MPKRSMRHDELIKRLKPFHVFELIKRGKGSHRMLYSEEANINYPIKYHGKQTEYSEPVLKNIIRKFGLPGDCLD